MRDTPPEIEERMRVLYASKTPEERLRMVSSMYDAGIALLTAGIRQQQPDISDTELRGEIFRRMYYDCFSDEEMARIVRFLTKEV